MLLYSRRKTVTCEVFLSEVVQNFVASVSFTEVCLHLRDENFFFSKLLTGHLLWLSSHHAGSPPSECFIALRKMLFNKRCCNSAPEEGSDTLISAANSVVFEVRSLEVDEGCSGYAVTNSQIVEHQKQGSTFFISFTGWLNFTTLSPVFIYEILMECVINDIIN